MTNSKKQEKVCAVICNWNRVQELLDCIDSVLKSNYSNFDLVVVDNGSDPQYLLEIKKQLHPSVILIENEKNEGGAAGFNRGMQYALDRGVYDSICLLDNDVIVDPDCLRELVTELRRSEDNGIVGAMILQMDFPDLLYELGAYLDRQEFVHHRNLNNSPICKVDAKVVSVDYVAACCLLVDTDKLKKVGLMDSAYFLYFDDVDWCLRFKQAGYEVKATTLAKVWHKSGGANKTNGVPRYYWWRNLTYLFLHNLNSDKDTEHYIDKFLLQKVLTALFIALKTGKINAFKSILSGIVDCFLGVRGKIQKEKIFPIDTCNYGSDFSDSINLEAAVQGDKVMQDFELEPFAMGADHSQMVKAAPIANGYGSKDCVNLSPSTAVSRVKEIMVISDARVADDFIQPFLKTQKHLLLPIRYYGGHHNSENGIGPELFDHLSQEAESKTLLVLCEHILTMPNQHEAALHSLLAKRGDAVYFIDPFNNLVHGFDKMLKVREEYNILLSTVNIFRSELTQFVKQKYLEFFKPLVSVVIPTFNQVEFLVEAIASVQKQTYPNIEIVVVNDGSKDNTADVLKKLSEQDHRIRYFNQENQGFAVATNKAIQESKGEYIVHLDSDDVYEPEKIEKQLEMLEQDKSIDLVYTAIQVIDRDGKHLMQMRGSDIDPDTFLAQMLFRSIMPNPTTIMGKRECFLDVPYREKYKRSVDYDRVLRLAEKYRFKYLDLPLTRWRRHDRNLTNELEKYKEEQFDMLKGYDVKVLMSYVDKAKLNLSEKLMLKGNILYNLERWEDALEQFKEVQSSAGDFYCGNCLFKMRNIKEAIASYRQCLQHNPNNAACWNNLGVALGDAAEAEECFKKALQIRPEYLDPQYNLSHSDKRFTDRELRQELIPYALQ